MQHLHEKRTERLRTGVCSGQFSAALRVPIVLELTRVGSDHKLLNNAVSKLLEKGAIERVEDD